MFTNIIVATDRVNVCDAPVTTALSLAQRHKAKLNILHVLESTDPENRNRILHFQTNEQISMTQAYEKEVETALTQTYTENLPSDVVYDIQIATGFPWQAILQQALKVDSDLIVLGSHSTQALKKGIIRVAGKIGSTVEGVVTHENCPVMIANRSFTKHELGFKKILVGVDFSASCECAICFTVKMAQKHNAMVMPFHMLPIPPYPKYEPDDYQADIAKSKQELSSFCHNYLDGMDHDYYIWGGALPHLELLKCAQQTEADLIVLGSHTKETAGKWYAGSVVERVSHYAPCPVIVVNDPEALLAWEDIPRPSKKTDVKRDRLIHVFSGA